MRERITTVSILGIVLLGALTARFWLGPFMAYLLPRISTQTVRPPNEIVFWYPFRTREFTALVKRFEESHPGVHVKMVFAPPTSQKLFTAVAAGQSPDVTFITGPQVPQWATQGLLMPLDKYIKEAGIKPSDYFKPCWVQNLYNGHVWALTFSADPNFPLAWNKDSFRAAGLDPDKPPRTIAELDSYAEKLTRQDHGQIESMGIIPWGQYGYANSMNTWGWVFGGSFYDPARRKVTCNDPKIVEALEWMCSYAKKYDVKKVGTFNQVVGGADINPFYMGRLAMMCMVTAQVPIAKRLAPDLPYGLTFLPYPPGGERHSAWIGVRGMIMPKGCRNPDLAWEFIRWFCADPEGSATVGTCLFYFPGYVKSHYFDMVKDDPHLGIYLKILAEAKHQKPVMPACDFYDDALDQAVESALYGLKTPKQALDDACRDTQRELDLRLKGE